MTGFEVGLDRRGRVRAAYGADLPLSRRRAWRTLADFERIVCLDLFHRSVDLGGRPPAPGVDFDLPHRAVLFELPRRGRILRWDEGAGYAFSDLRESGRGFFPHVFVLALEDGPSSTCARCRLRLEIRGLWTTAWIPRWAGRAWIGWHLQAMGARIRHAILADTLRALDQSSDGRGRRRAPT